MVRSLLIVKAFFMKLKPKHLYESEGIEHEVEVLNRATRRAARAVRVFLIAACIFALTIIFYIIIK